jgi:hypothetical protein
MAAPPPHILILTFCLILILSLCSSFEAVELQRLTSLACSDIRASLLVVTPVRAAPALDLNSEGDLPGFA